MQMHFPLRVGYAEREITQPRCVSLAGRPMLVRRRARATRDYLSARAVHIESRSGTITFLVADLLLVTKALHEQVASASGCQPENLILLATHTHSGPGGYWQGKHVESFMGPYSQDSRDRLVQSLSDTAGEAGHCTRSSALSAVSIDTRGLNINRRNHTMSVDSVLTVLRFDVEGDSPVCTASFGAHPIAALERRPFTMTADYPREICRRLKSFGMRPLFVQGACGATSPALNLGRALVKEIDSALPKMQACDVARVLVEHIPLQLSSAETRITPDGLPFLRTVEDGIRPLRRYLMRMAQQGAIDNQNLSLTIIGMGRIVFVGVPGEVGPALSMAIRRLFSPKIVIVASLCNGYAGYIHKRDDYQYERGTTALALYENAMSLAGRDAGDSILSQIEQSRIRMAL